MSQAFISYCHADEQVLDRLHVHMATLKREGQISTWFDKQILAGQDLDTSIDTALNSSGLFIAIVSPDYLNSNYCYNLEFKRAQEMHQQGKLLIVPIIAQPCDWHNSPFGKMKAIPKDGKAVSEWTNANNAFLNIIDEIRRLLEARQRPKPVVTAMSGEAPKQPARGYKLQRDFSAIDLLEFKEQCFEEIHHYFTEALSEINEVSSIQARFTSEEKQVFSCMIVNRARMSKNTGYLTVFAGTENAFGRTDLGYYFTERLQNVSMLDNAFMVEHDNYEMYWKERISYSQQGPQKLTAKQIAEILWTKFIEQVGISFSN